MRKEEYQYKKRRNRSRLVLALLISIILFIILLLSLILLIMDSDGQIFHFGQTSSVTQPLQNDTQQTETAKKEPVSQPETAETESMTEKLQEAQTQQDERGNIRDAASFASLKETDIYTFLQGPKAWKSKTDWSGMWHKEVLHDQEFSVFGCGLCNLANIYSTLTPYDCSPLDMYYYAQEASGYTPVSGYGAIDWRYLKQTLKSTGIKTKTRRKDRTYEQFQEQIAGSITAIALVSSYYDDTYWHDVEGHYVNIWLYNSEDDTVFLADSGNPDHNRQRIPLRYIYDALKRTSRLHYLLVTEVDEDANTWKHDGINIAWNKPKYYKGGSVKNPKTNN